ncbi:MAG: hypothetical protein WC227_00030 [Patescibacteria group bacterium]|jgi:hypothetical protein
MPEKATGLGLDGSNVITDKDNHDESAENIKAQETVRKLEGFYNEGMSIVSKFSETQDETTRKELMNQAIGLTKQIQELITERPDINVGISESNIEDTVDILYEAIKGDVDGNYAMEDEFNLWIVKKCYESIRDIVLLERTKGNRISVSIQKKKISEEVDKTNSEIKANVGEETVVVPDPVGQTTEQTAEGPNQDIIDTLQEIRDMADAVYTDYKNYDARHLIKIDVENLKAFSFDSDDLERLQEIMRWTDELAKSGSDWTERLETKKMIGGYIHDLEISAKNIK